MYLRQYDSSIDCFTKALFLELAAEMSFAHVWKTAYGWIHVVIGEPDSTAWCDFHAAGKGEAVFKLQICRWVAVFFLVVEVHALQEDYKSAIDVYTEAQNHSNHKSGELGDSFI